MAGTSHYNAQYLWDVITCPGHWYLLLAQYSSYGVPFIGSQSDRSSIITGCRNVIDIVQYWSTMYRDSAVALRWRNSGLDGVSNHQPHDCLLNRLFRHRSKKTSNLRVTGLCVGYSPGTGEFPAQRASYAEKVSIWWRHHVCLVYRNTVTYITECDSLGLKSLFEPSAILSLYHYGNLC